MFLEDTERFYSISNDTCPIICKEGFVVAPYYKDICIKKEEERNVKDLC